jgi:hypothetical protein
VSALLPIFATLIVAVAFAPAALAADLDGLTVIGVAADGTPTTLTEYRWLVEEDLTYHVPVVGGVPQSDEDTLAVSFHHSYMPVHAKGCTSLDMAWQTAAACKDVPFVNTGSHYYVSVVPRSGYSIGGATYDPVSGATVYVNEHPIPTAQISILIFEDNFPINNAPDLPGEDPMNDGATDMSGFQIVVEDAGGRWGASAGVQSQDAFGNVLGTTYDAMGNPTGFAPLITDSSGRLTIQNLAPGKYGISAVPPAGAGWQQTSTIEGTRIIDAWVKAKEPPFFAEFGPPGFHAFIGYVREFDEIPAGGGATITGTVVNQHLSRPPDYAFYNGSCFGHTTPWVGLNDLSVGIGQGIYAAATDDECKFSIPDVPDGNYQLVFWDNNLDLIFAFKGISIVGGQCNTPTGCVLGDVPVFQWFHRQEHFVYNDINGNGIYEDGLGETPILEQAVILRWRDGTVYQENVSDPAGLYAFDQIFPFFAWLVTEVDFARFEATSLTVVADNGGPIPLGGVPGPSPENDLTFGGAIAPQDQTNPPDPECVDPAVCTETTDYRIDLGPVLTAGFQGFIGQTHAFQWGKRHYADGENGGISGIVFYAITRAEDDPAMAAGEPWEPGIPGVTVNLYESLGVDPETGVATRGALLDTTTTDSWDDSIPTGCKFGNGAMGPFHYDPDGPGPLGKDTDCFDGLRNFNQVRPAVFDGGYAFGPEVDCPGDVCPSWVNQSADDPSIGFIKPDDYIVEIIAPPGYEILKPEDKNVDFGDAYEPAPELLPVPCGGDLTVIPPYLTFNPDEQIESPFAWEGGVYVAPSRPLCDRKPVTLSAGANAAADFWLFTEVPVSAHGFGFILDDTQSEFDPNSPQFGEKYAPPFVPVTVRDWTGRIINKTLSDQYGRYNFLAPSTITTNLPAPSGMSPNMLTTCMNDPGDDPNNPDPNHNQLYSTFCYTFQYMPGTTTYLDTPVVPVAAFTGPDQFPLDCEQADGAPRIYSVDVQTNGAGGGPYIPTMEDPLNPGMWITNGAQTITITSMGPRLVQNPNYCNAAAGDCPAGADTINKVITRDYGFGATAGTVTLGELGALSCTWGEPITCTVPGGTAVSERAVGNQLTVTRSNGLSTVAGVTVQTGLRAGANVIVVSPDMTQGATPIQDAIGTDVVAGAGSNDLILVRPGRYNELVVMWKPVQLQGWGEGSTEINAIKAPADKLEDWRALVDGLVTGGKVDLLPGQEAGGGPPEPLTLQTEEGAGVLVLAKAGGGDAFDQSKNLGARIDGFTIKSADTGGGIIVNGYGDYLDISNNRISNNSGFFGGGIRVGHPELVAEADLVMGGCPDGGAICYVDGDNDYVDIHHNQVVFNGGLGGAGGGISMCTGSDAYRITENWVCGNFSLRDGGGIGHTGLSDGVWVTIPDSGPQRDRVWTLTDIPLIEDNTVIFNESFYQAQTVSGGGIFVGGAQPLAPGALTPGAGNVQVNGNLIQGNSAGAGDGGGIRLAGINGQDVADNPDNDPRRNGNAGRTEPPPWNAVDVFNNMIVNNVAALAGGGISLQDALDVHIVNNTIANNDSLGVAGEAFPPNSPNESNPQPGAGIVTRPHGGALAGSGGNPVLLGTFSDPTAFDNNIVWQNRKFFFFVDETSGCTPADPGCVSTYGLCPDLNEDELGDPDPIVDCTLSAAYIGGVLTDPTAPWYDDLAVIGAGTLACDTSTSCILTGGSDPLFEAEYVNGDRSSVFQPEVNTAIQAPPAFDEGGNFIRPSYGPLALYDDATPNDGDPGSLFGDYHIMLTSPAKDVGVSMWTSLYLALGSDFDGESRPYVATVEDIGADELQAAAVAPTPAAQPEATTEEPAADAGTPQQVTKAQSKD